MSKKPLFGTATLMRAKQIKAQHDLNLLSRKMLDNMTTQMLPQIQTHVADSMSYAMQGLDDKIERNRIAQEWNRRYYEQTPAQRWDNDVENPPQMTKKMSECDHIPDHVKMMFDRVTEDGGRQSGRNFVWAKDWDEFKATLLLLGVNFSPSPSPDNFISVPFMNSLHVIGEGHAVNITDLNTYYGIKTGAINPHGDRVFD